MNKKYTKLYTFKAQEDLKQNINDVLDKEESISSFIRKAIYNEIIERKKLLQDDYVFKTRRIKPIVLG